MHPVGPNQASEVVSRVHRRDGTGRDCEGQLLGFPIERQDVRLHRHHGAGGRLNHGPVSRSRGSNVRDCPGYGDRAPKARYGNGGEVHVGDGGPSSRARSGHLGQVRDLGVIVAHGA